MGPGLDKDLFRQEYSEVSEENKQIAREVKQKAQELYELMYPHAGRYTSIAITELEQAIMAFVKGIFAKE